MSHVTSKPGSTAALPEVSSQKRHAVPDLVVFFGPAANRALPVDRPIRIGRDPGCELPLTDDSAVSHAHAELRPANGQLVLCDLGSRNGTFLNGRRVHEALLDEPSVIRVGESLLSVGWWSERWSPPRGEPFVGGRSLQNLRRQAKLIGPTELPVLVLGETGSGKDVLAHAIHARSGRTGPLIAVNCAALPDALAESELFGHARAAFTGASSAGTGLFVAAHKGTLFLDEVGELTPTLQSKLLRVLEDKKVRPVGATQSREVDVRILSATNRDIRNGTPERFRPDLLARLAGVEMTLPPLRQRIEDLPALVAHLLDRAGQTGVRLSCDAAEAMALYDWPMNIRELDSVIRSSLLGAQGQVELSALPPRVRAPLEQARFSAPTRSSRPPSKTTQRADVEAMLQRHRGNIRRSSQDLGISRTHLYRLLKRWDVSPHDFRDGVEEGTGFVNARENTRVDGTPIAEEPWRW